MASLQSLALSLQPRRGCVPPQWCLASLLTQLSALGRLHSLTFSSIPVATGGTQLPQSASEGSLSDVGSTASSEACTEGSAAVPPSTAEAVGAALAALPALQHIEVHDAGSHGCGGAGVAAWASALAGPRRLRSVAVTQTAVAARSYATLGAALATAPQLTRLQLRACGLSNGTAAALAAELPRLAHLRHLCLSGNLHRVLCTAGGAAPPCRAAALAAGLPALTQLHSLDISSCNLSAAQFRALAPGLHALPALEHLDLRRNHIHIPGDLEHWEDVAQLTTLSALLLSDNTIGALALGRHLARLTRLRRLDCARCGLGVELHRMRSFDHLAGLTGLQHVDLSANGAWGAYAMRKLAPAIAHFVGLTALKLAGNDAGPGGGAALAPALRALTNLQLLDLSCNTLSSDGARALATALPSLCQLRELDLSDNGLRRCTPAVLMCELYHLPQLTRLALDGQHGPWRGS